MTQSRTDIARLIDHTLLKPDATPAMIDHLCEEALAHHFCAVCVSPVYVRQAAARVAGSAVKVCTVVGFPSGMVETPVKVFEAGQALAQGADEIDMVMRIGALKAGDRAVVAQDIAAVAEAVAGKVLKVIIETCLLSEAEKIEACRVAVKSGASFVKTSTGFSHGGATVEDVRLVRRTVGPDIGVKASGGIRTDASARAMLEAGASRLGTSAGLSIIGLI